jgi:hypothetical protein
MCMRQLTKYFLWIGCLALSLPCARAFSLLGPVANGGDAWQVTLIGYNPLPSSDAAYSIADPLLIGPKNLGEGYRRNTPVMYYAFDPSYSDYFGSNGEFAVQQAFDLLNGVLNGQTNSPVFLTGPGTGVVGDTSSGPAITLSPTNGLDQYTTGLSEFPLNSEGVNYSAQVLNLQDVKSFALFSMVEQLGLADAIRYTWTLHTRFVPVGAVCNPPGPGFGVEYSVVQRNYDIVPSQLTNIQYSPYVNNELYTYSIYENCGLAGASPPDAAARPYPVNPLVNNPPVASGPGLGFPGVGTYYTGLTRDDVGGLRWIYSTNNNALFAPSTAYRESPAAGSLFFNTNFNLIPPPVLYTSNLNALVTAARTNSPTALQALFPGLSVNSTFLYYTNVTSIGSVTFVTNFPLGYSGGVIAAVTNYVTNSVPFFSFSFGNVVTNKSYSTTTYQLQTITFGPVVGQPADGAFVFQTNYQSFQSNIVSGDFFIITNGACGPDIVQTNQIFVNVVTNAVLTGVTNADGSFFVQNLISFFTNYSFAVYPCTLTTNAVADYQGIGRVQFIRVRDDNYDYLLGQFITPITNQYTMVVFTNGQNMTRTFSRVVTTPDFLYTATDQASGPASPPGNANGVGRSINFDQSNIQPGLAGPGTIVTPTVFTFSKAGPVYVNSAPAMLNQASATSAYLWGSFDGTTNPPVLYPNGTSLQNLAAEAVVQISPPPPALPNGTNGAAYNVTLAATGTTGLVTWSLAPNSAGLPPGLTLSAGGVVSGTPTQSATYVNIVIQMTDSSTPPRTVQTVYSLTIN